MSELLGLGACIGLHALLHQELTHRVLNVRRLHQEIVRKLQIAVILQHACIEYLRLLRHREGIKALSM